jgi:group II intron reverse transcriptase/maturase
MSLTTPEKIQKLQTALHAKAKENPAWRFHALYDKVYRKDFLAHAYACCKSNRGAAGVDDQRFEDIEEYGLERWLEELAQELKEKRYRPQAVKRVWIPKAGQPGKLRPLGIPTIRDRTAQMAAVLVLTPIIEADLQPEQYAYRPNRSALDAVSHVHRLLKEGHREVVDADLSGYFDNIPHAELMQSLARRIVDGAMLHLVKMWLEAAVEEEDQRGGRHRTTCNRDEGKGTPQGAVISPLLSNLYMRRFILGWKTLGYEERFGARIVNYADDFVICCRGRADKAQNAMQDMMGKLKLTVNPEKTKVCRLPEESFDFLGYTIGRCYCPRKRWRYIGTKPSKKRIARFREAITEATDRRHACRATTEEMVQRLNRMLEGWSNYFTLGMVSRAYVAVEHHTTDRLRQWLCRKHKVRGRGTAIWPNEYLYDELGLLNIKAKMRNSPWAKAWMLGPRAGCGKSARPVR